MITNLIVKFLESTLEDEMKACHSDGYIQETCVIDNDEAYNCIQAEVLLQRGQGRDDCKYWREADKCPLCGHIKGT